MSFHVFLLNQNYLDEIYFKTETILMFAPIRTVLPIRNRMPESRSKYAQVSVQYWRRQKPPPDNGPRTTYGQQTTPM